MLVRGQTPQETPAPDGHHVEHDTDTDTERRPEPEPERQRDPRSEPNRT